MISNALWGLLWASSLWTVRTIYQKSSSHEGNLHPQNISRNWTTKRYTLQIYDSKYFNRKSLDVMPQAKWSQVSVRRKNSFIIELIERFFCAHSTSFAVHFFVMLMRCHSSSPAWPSLSENSNSTAQKFSMREMKDFFWLIAVKVRQRLSKSISQPIICDEWGSCYTSFSWKLKYMQQRCYMLILHSGYPVADNYSSFSRKSDEFVPWVNFSSDIILSLSRHFTCSI